MQLRPEPDQRGIGVDQRHCRTNDKVMWVVFNAPQLRNFGHVDDLFKLHVLLGHPQAHIGAAGN